MSYFFKYFQILFQIGIDFTDAGQTFNFTVQGTLPGTDNVVFSNTTSDLRLQVKKESIFIITPKKIYLPGQIGYFINIFKKITI